MPIILPHELTSAEIRILQEFRRLNAERLALETVQAIKHPAGGGEAPAVSLASKGFVTADGDGFALTSRGRDFLAIEARPMGEEPAPKGGSAAAESAPADEA